jgi:hypothetical protein
MNQDHGVSIFGSDGGACIVAHKMMGVRDRALAWKMKDNPLMREP